jgi:hypothetical protein
VQLPLFLSVGQPEVVREHRRRNTTVLTLPMLVELVTAVLVGQVVAIALVAVIWIVTFAWYIPAYSRLQKGYDKALIRRLMALHWIRTASWTARAGILLWIIANRLNIY